jgi:hypothetical protein
MAHVSIEAFKSDMMGESAEWEVVEDPAEIKVGGSDCGSVLY